MRAVFLTGYGGVDNLELRDVPEPIAGRGELKVRVIAASVNPIDLKLRSGAVRQWAPLELPAILGRDASGEVALVTGAVGSVGRAAVFAASGRKRPAS
jgi:NADPH:quinone reductase-like Zn-dependent oxidoreductase